MKRTNQWFRPLAQVFSLAAAFAVFLTAVASMKADANEQQKESFYYGDVDQNHRLEAVDGLLILKDVVDLQPIEDEMSRILADADRNGTVEAADALIVLKVVVKLTEPVLYNATPVTAAPIITEAPLQTDAPEITDTPLQTDAPDITDAPVLTDAPDITDTPVPTDAPEVTDTPVPTDAPEITDTPVPTDAPDITDTPVPTNAPTVTNEPLKPETEIPPSYREENLLEPGTVTTIEYQTKDYLGDQHEITKSAYVYLPYGYEETKQYNVIYAMHGVGGTSNEWEIAKNKSLLKKYFDNMIYNKDMEPVIVVFPTGRSCADYNDTSNGGMNSNMQAFYLFGQELRNDLIPYIDEHFATYADYAPGYDMTLARDHRGMCGFSMGGMQTINIGMCECLDIISSFGAFSAAPTTYSANEINRIVSEQFGDYDIQLFYNICGSSDTIALASHKAAMDGLVEGSNGRLIEGENFVWHQVSGGHVMGVWQIGIYNFAKMAFR